MHDQPERGLPVAGPASGGVPYIVLIAFFLSGAAGVMHEVVWSRQLVTLLGAEAWAQAIVLAVFMGGLAVGAVVLGRRADRGRPLILYVRLELLVAGYALLLPVLLAAAGALYVAAARRFFESDAVRLLLRLALATLAVAPPAVMMGGTLPVLARRLAAHTTQVRAKVGALYAINSAGAVVGTALAGFVCLPWLGLWGALVAAAAANVAAALVVLPLARAEKVETPIERARAALADDLVPRSRARVAPVVLVAALFASGFCAMGYEVLFVRVVGLAFGSSTYSFTVMLMGFIAGIAIGSALVSRRQWQASLTLVGASQIAVAVAFAAATPLLARLPYLIARLRIALQGVGGGFELAQLAAGGLCLGVLLLPTACLGVPFPTLAEARVDRASRIGGQVGNTYAYGTIGNVLGVLATTLLVLPRLGVEGGFHLFWAINVLAGLALLVVAGGSWRIRVGVVATAAAAFALYAGAGRGWSQTLTMAPDHLMLRTGPGPSATARQRAEHPATSFASWRRHYLLTAADPPLPTIEVRHDAHATAVAFGADPGGPDGMALMVNDKTDASTVGDLDTQMMLAHAPLLLAPHTARLLVIGHGSGITAGSALVHPVERADIVEISPAVLALDHLFAPVNHQVLSDRRVHVYVEDAQSFLRAVPRQYDVIISEPSNPWVAGVGNLFTREFFTLARARLAPGGVFTFWFHTYAQTDDTTALLLRTLGTVFPAAELFTDDAGSDVVAVASAEPLPVDFAVIERRFGVPGVRQDLARLGLPQAEPLATFLTRHRLSQRGATSLAGPGPLNLVAREQLQYRGPRALFAGHDSFFVERRDPLLKPRLDPSSTLFARYLHHRAAQGRPVRPEDLEAIADHVEGRGGNGAQVAAIIRRRSWR